MQDKFSLITYNKVNLTTRLDLKCLVWMNNLAFLGYMIKLVSCRK